MSAAGYDPADRWEGKRRHAPATQRNREPIGDQLAGILPEKGLVLEIASGSGEHALCFAQRFPALDWRPSDPDPDALNSIAAWRDSDGSGLPNLKEPVLIDAASTDWPVDQADAMLCVNMVHISPWEATKGLFAGAARILPPSAPLVIYGPFFAADIETASSNFAFDRSLQMRDPRWGLRNIEDVDVLAAQHGFTRKARHQLPANNLLLEYRRV